MVKIIRYVRDTTRQEYEELIMEQPNDSSTLDNFIFTIKDDAKSDVLFKYLCRKLLKIDPRNFGVKEVFDETQKRLKDKMLEKKLSKEVSDIDLYKQYAITEDLLRKNPDDKKLIIRAAKFNLYFGRKHRAKVLLEKAGIEVRKKPPKNEGTDVLIKNYKSLPKNPKDGIIIRKNLFEKNIWDHFKELLRKFVLLCTFDRKDDECLKLDDFFKDNETPIYDIKPEKRSFEERYGRGDGWEANCTNIINDFRAGKPYEELFWDVINTSLNSKDPFWRGDHGIEIEDRIRLYEQLIKINPDDAYVLGSLGMDLCKTYKENLHIAFMAKTLCNKALELNPEFDELCDFLEWKPFDKKLENFDDIKNTYEKLISKEQELQNNPNDYNLSREVANLYAGFGRYYKAVEYLSKSLSLRGFYAEVGFNYDITKHLEEITDSIFGIVPLPEIFLMDENAQNDYSDLIEWLKKIGLKHLAKSFNWSCCGDIDKKFDFDDGIVYI